jgi:N-glycosylase/DNA lyase
MLRTQRQGRLRYARQKAASRRSLIVPRGEPFNLEHTLLSGQTFRWRKDDDGFVGVVSERLLKIMQDGRRLLYSSCGGDVEPSEVAHYLGLGDCYAEAVRAFRVDPILHTALRNLEGMRILRQDPWETLISFIISSNNNIVRIKRCVESLCSTFGEKITGVPGVHAFPIPDALANASLRRLQQLCNLGYRHAYIREAARKIARSPDLLSQIARLPYAEARKELMNLPGVGQKVADCVLLYSMGKYEAFPVDTWVRKAMQRFYFKGQPVADRAIRAFAADRFGPFAGYAQIYLFHFARGG